MDYTNQSVRDLLRGPLLHTPQGIVVCASAIGYLVFALFVLLGAVVPPLKLGISGVIVGAIGYPIILFLLFVKHGEPSFSPSWLGTILLMAYAVFPIGFVLWRT